MLYKNTLEKLRKEEGINYLDMDQVSKAISISYETMGMYNKEILSRMCFHNVILDKLYEYNVISADKKNFYYDLPSYICILNDLDDSITMHLNINPNTLFLNEIKDVQNRLRIIKQNLKDDVNLVKISKPFIKHAELQLKDKIKESKKEQKALLYAKKRLLKRKEKQLNEKIR